ncbi:MAG: hypothetical protein WEB37_01425 [Bacteroidota bacterium]
MTLARKILSSWLAVVGVFAIAYFSFDHSVMNLLSIVVNVLLLLLGIISLMIFVREPNKKNKPVFLNFSIFFLLSIANLIYPFIGNSILPGNQFAALYFYQYVPSGLTIVVLSLAIVYVAIDTLFNELSIPQKYIVVAAIVIPIAAFYYSPFISDPKHSYKTEDITDFKSVDNVIRELIREGLEQPKPEQIATRIKLSAWQEGKQVGVLFEKENIQRITTILPYIEGDNFILLLFKPIHMNIIFMNVLSLMFVFVFFGYQYKNDPPQGAYIEKIVFLFLPYFSLDILHFFAYVTSNNYASYLELYSTAQYLVVFNLFLLLIFFSLRLSFITSIKGEFYERELVLDSEHISRWRDGIDSLVVRHFLNPKTIHGRLFAPRESKSRA